MGPELVFLGGAATVTGSKYLIRTDAESTLVDCGLFQGLKQLRLRNRAPLPVKPGDIARVILTHAHIDHSGYLPVLARDGFAGPVFATPATCDLCAILLPDSGHLHEEEAVRANRYGYSKHHPALPLYTHADAVQALHLLTPVPFDTERRAGSVSFGYQYAGHILGAASIMLDAAGRRVVFSGDLGRSADPMLNPPARIQSADYVIVESTYGDRTHEAEPVEKQLATVVRRTLDRGGVVVIPAFAVGRTQTMMYLLHRLRSAGEIPDVPVYVDSPMACDVTELMLRYASGHRLSRSECEAVFHSAHLARSIEESKAIDNRSGPMVIISASGMATGGRVLFHLKRFAGDARNTILLVGYQAAGTRGDALQRGARTLRIHGADVIVRAEVAKLDGLSAHADADELMDWLKGFEQPPKRTFITHGEPVAADALRFRIQNELGWDAHVPEHGETAVLE